MENNIRAKQIKQAARIYESEEFESIPFFIEGAEWSDKNPYWIDGNDLPLTQYTPEGLPKLYLCQIMTLDATFGWRFSYRVGFINDENKWNIENLPLTRVTKYMNINCDESDNTKMKYIEQFNKEL